MLDSKSLCYNYQTSAGKVISLNIFGFGHPPVGFLRILPHICAHTHTHTLTLPLMRACSRICRMLVYRRENDKSHTFCTALDNSSQADEDDVIIKCEM